MRAVFIALVYAVLAGSAAAQQPTNSAPPQQVTLPDTLTVRLEQPSRGPDAGPWIAFASALLVAVVAGGFALFQAQAANRSTAELAGAAEKHAAMRESSERHERELEKVRAENRRLEQETELAHRREEQSRNIEANSTTEEARLSLERRRLLQAVASGDSEAAFEAARLLHDQAVAEAGIVLGHLESLSDPGRAPVAMAALKHCVSSELFDAIVLVRAGELVEETLQEAGAYGGQNAKQAADDLRQVLTQRRRSAAREVFALLEAKGTPHEREAAEKFRSLLDAVPLKVT